MFESELSGLLDNLFDEDMDEIKWLKLPIPGITASCCSYNYACYND